MRSLFIATLVFLFTLPVRAQSDTLDILFDFDSFDLKQEEKQLIDQVLNPSPDFTGGVELRGHCDSRGSDAYNIRLSQSRVQSVRRYILSKGFPEKKILESIGFGERHPMADNNTDEGRALNRRVEVIFSSVKLNDTVSLKEKLSDPRLTAGTTISLRNLNFVGGRSLLLDESLPILQELLEALQKHPTLVIQIEGHICCNPGPEDGYDIDSKQANLSESRARAIRAYLIENGIASSRLSYRGFGHSQPLYPFPEQSEEERTANRRVEIRIIRK